MYAPIAEIQHKFLRGLILAGGYVGRTYFCRFIYHSVDRGTRVKDSLYGRNLICAVKDVSGARVGLDGINPRSVSPR